MCSHMDDGSHFGIFLMPFHNSILFLWYIVCLLVVVDSVFIRHINTVLLTSSFCSIVGPGR